MIKSNLWKIKYEKGDSNKTLLERLKKARNISDADLHLNLENLYDPYLLPDMNLAVSIIKNAILKNHKILCYGDYDVDGVISIKTIYGFLKELGCQVQYYIPDRLEEGYGILQKGVDFIIANKFDLVITVDCGVSAIEQIKEIKENNISVVVTDHHVCPEILPPADAIVNCWRKDSTYPFPNICGAQVSLKLVQALCVSLELPDFTWKNYIKYVAIATIADVMPLSNENLNLEPNIINENRIIINYGIEEIKKDKCLSISYLIRQTEKYKNLSELQASDIAYYIAPMINASSRLGDVEIAMQLFLCESEDEFEYQILANQLKELNEKRKEIESTIFKEANNYILNNINLKSTNTIVVKGNKWHKGIIGIVAAKLVELYGRPIIILSKEEESSEYHGSCRTYGEISIIKILKHASEYILRYGGHAEAAGLTVLESNLSDFTNKVKEYDNMFLTDEMLYFPFKEADMEINIDDISLQNASDLLKLKPYGKSNPEPLFVCKNLKIVSMSLMGSKTKQIKSHIKIIFSSQKNNLYTITAIGFYKNEYFNALKIGDSVDVMFKFSINNYNGEKTVQIMIDDISFPMNFKNGTTTDENSLYLEDEIDINSICEEYDLELDVLLPSNEEYLKVCKATLYFLECQKNDIILTDLDSYTTTVGNLLKINLNPFKVARILETIAAANYIEYKELLFGNIIIKKSSLPDSERIHIKKTIPYKKNHTIGE